LGIDCLKGRTKRDRDRRLLLDTLGVAKEEKLVLDDWTADPAPELVALKRCGNAPLRSCKQCPLILVVVEGLPMEGIRSGACRYQNLTGRSYVA
jgi:hypothetical protein